jgi:ACS family glucarate transporter-like MFS transporter
MLVLVSASLTCISSALTLNIAMTSDLVWNPNMVGTAMGLLILGGNLFGIVAPIVTGLIVKWTGSFGNAFYVAGALLACGILTSLTMTRRPLSFDVDAATN